MKGFLLILSVLLAFIREHDGNPRVHLLPRFPVVYVGDDVNLVCKNISEPITWLINGSAKSTGSILRLTAVTSENDGSYVCKGGGSESNAYELRVLMLEPHAQLSSPEGGPVLIRGEARILTLRVDDNLTAWKCFVFRNDSGFRLTSTVNHEIQTVSVYAEMKDAQTATFWCLHNKTHRSNTVTLRMTDQLVMLEPPAAPVLRGESVTLRCAVWGKPKVVHATFYKLTDGKSDPIPIEQKSETYTINNVNESDDGQYKCKATYSYSHISSEAAERTGGSDPQPLKVIGGPPSALLSVSGKSLGCSCPQCPGSCKKYYWYHTDDSNIRRKLEQTSQYIDTGDAGRYTCRAECGGGFSRFSEEHDHRGGASLQGVIVAALLIVFGVLIIVLVALKWRRRRGNRQPIREGKDIGQKERSGGDYEQIGLTNKAIYNTLGEAQAEGAQAEGAQAEGGYEALKKTEEEKGVYHTLGEAQAEGAQAEGGYEALKKTEEKGVYHTLGKATDQEKVEGGYEALKKREDEEKGVYHTLGEDQSKGESQAHGGYEALQNVKAQVYQTLSSEKSKKAEGEAEGGYEQLPQKTGDHKNMEENPYEELKAEKQGKKK